MEKVRVGAITKIRTGKLDANAANSKGRYPFFTCAKEPLNIDSYSYDCECVLVAGNGDLNVKYYNGKFDAYQRTYIIEDASNGKLYIPYLYFFLNHYLDDLRKQSIGGVVKYIKLSNLTDIALPLFDLETQREMVAKLVKIKKAINYRQRQIRLLDKLVKSQFIEMFGDPMENPMGWEKLQLQQLVSEDCSISYGIVKTGNDVEGGIPVFRPVDIVGKVPTRAGLKRTTPEISNQYKRSLLTGRDLLVTVRANIADTFIAGEEFKGCNVGRGIVPVRTNESKVRLEFLKSQMDFDSMNRHMKALAKGITLIQLNMEDLRCVEFIVPPIDVQDRYIAVLQQSDKSKVIIQQCIDKLEILQKALMQKYFG